MDYLATLRKKIIKGIFVESFPKHIVMYNEFYTAFVRNTLFRKRWLGAYYEPGARPGAGGTDKLGRYGSCSLTSI